MKKKSSENDQLTGHFQNFFNWSFSELFFIIIISPEKQYNKGKPTVCIKFFKYFKSGQDNHFSQCYSQKYADRTSKKKIKTISTKQIIFRVSIQNKILF